MQKNLSPQRPKNTRAQESDTAGFPVGRGSVTVTHLCTPWHLCSGGKAQAHPWANSHPCSSTRSSHECWHTDLQACTVQKLHTHLRLQTRPKYRARRKKQKEKERRDIMTAIFLISFANFYQWPFVCNCIMHFILLPEVSSHIAFTQ